MKIFTTNGGLPAGNPIANIFVVIVGALAIGALMVLGFFAFVIVSSVVLVMAGIIGLRVWWFKRKLGKQSPLDETSNPTSPGGVIEGEYQVVADDPDDE